MDTLKKERHELENACNKLLSFATKAGARAAEVCGAYSHTTRIALEKQDYHLASSDEGYGLGIRVITDQKQGFASCNSTAPDVLKEVALRAVEISSFSPANPYYTIQAAPNIPQNAPKSLWDDAIHGVSLQTQKDWTKRMVTEVTKDKRIRLDGGAVETSSQIFVVSNSFGTHQVQKESEVSWNLMGMAVEGTLITSFDYFSEMARIARGIPERIQTSSQNFREELLKSLKQGSAKNYKGIVIFSPRAVMDVLISEIIYHFNGRQAADGTTKWKPNQIGEKILSPQLSIQDNPWLVDRTGCSLFDREGTPTRPTTLLEKGTFKSFLLDNYAATALKLQSTGNAAGGPSSVPTVGTHTLVVDNGKESLDSLLQRVTHSQKHFLLVKRFSGQVDPVTGDFSGVAKGAEWWEAGNVQYTVRETLISGNLFDALGSGLYGLSSETQIIHSGDEAPTFAIDGISVTAGK